MMRRAAIPLVAVSLLWACGEVVTPGPRTVSSATPAFAISDGAHSSGNGRFYFLPPMVTNPTTTGVFDPLVSPVVMICAWNGVACSAPPFATFSMTSGPGSETIRVDPTSTHYIVNWHTDQFDVAAGSTYRITVSVLGSVIGFADVAVVANAARAKNVTTGEEIPLVDGKTLPVKFRIEESMVVSVVVTPDPTAVILAKSANLTATLTDAHGNVVTGPPVTWASSASGIATVNGSGSVSGASLGTATITATSNGVSGSASVTVVPPPVASVEVTPATSAITAGQTVQLTATTKDADGNVLTGRLVTWASSAVGATVDANGLVSGAQAATYTITATSEGVSGSAPVIVTAAACVELNGPALGFWPFDEGTGTSTADLSGNGHTGNLLGTPTWATGAINLGHSLDFDDPTDFVSVGPFLTTGVPRFTVTAWVNPTSFTNVGDIGVGGVSGPRIISATDGGGWAIGHAPGTGKIQVELRGISSFILNTTFPLNTWSNLVVSYDGSRVKTYLDGSLVDDRAISGSGMVAQASSCTFIGNEPEGCGRQTNGNFAWQGRIDEVAVFDRALSAAEVLALHQRCQPSVP
jgi:hypothetical protein